MPKMHWCPNCRAFVWGVIRKHGYYQWDRVCCDRCDSVLGSPK